MKKQPVLPRYEKYKDSGVEWLGEVPEHWEVVRLGSLLQERRKQVSDKDYPALSVTKKGILPQLENAAKTKDGDNRKLVLAGDFVINSRSDRKGSSGLSNMYGSVSLINIVLKPINMIGKYAHYLLKSNLFIEEFYRVGRGIVADLWTTRYDDMRVIALAAPTVQEQTAIANFLDQKTAHIDQAIAIKEQQIELLKEHQQIIIQKAVTQGLDPDVPMKDSGVELIGEIPVHWNILKFKMIASLYNGMDYKSVSAIDGIPVLGSGGQFAYANNFLYDGEAVLLGRKGTIDKPIYINGKFWTIDTMFYSICRAAVSTKFFYYATMGIPFAFYSTSTALPSMTQTDLLNHKFALPEIEEQCLIVSFIEEKVSKLNIAINNYVDQIQKLKEYKATLINSAVTGKIKVV